MDLTEGLPAIRLSAIPRGVIRLKEELGPGMSLRRMSRRR